MYDKTPKDRALYVLSVFMIIFAYFVLLPVAAFLGFLTFAAIYDKEFLLALLFFALAIVCVLLNRVIIKADDRREAKIAKEILDAKYKYFEVKNSGCKYFGDLKFEYDTEEDLLELTGNQLRHFNKDKAFDVISYDCDGKLNHEVQIIEQIYKDEDKLVKDMREALLEYYKNEGETVREDDVYKLKYEELSISKEKGRIYISLSGVHEGKNEDIEVTASKYFGSDKYEYNVHRFD